LGKAIKLIVSILCIIYSKEKLMVDAIGRVCRAEQVVFDNYAGSLDGVTMRATFKTADGRYAVLAPDGQSTVDFSLNPHDLPATVTMETMGMILQAVKDIIDHQTASNFVRWVAPVEPVREEATYGGDTSAV
jgi:hypothetical protein